MPPMKKNPPKTSKEKAETRKKAVNDLAQALGFDTWRKFETAMKRAYEDGQTIRVKIGKVPYVTG